MGYCPIITIVKVFVTYFVASCDNKVFRFYCKGGTAPYLRSGVLSFLFILFSFFSFFPLIFYYFPKDGCIQLGMEPRTISLLLFSFSSPLHRICIVCAVFPRTFTPFTLKEIKEIQYVIGYSSNVFSSHFFI